MHFGPDFLLRGLMNLIPLVLSLSVHEFAHAWSAYLLGDDTAAREGRMTLNPIAHIDPIGTLLLPLLGIPFGWAKPVPVNPTRFRRSVPMTTGMMITAVAGPFSNLVLAVVCAIVTGLSFRFAPGWLEANPAIERLLLIGIVMNVGLAVFNMLPVPPLDGSRVVEGLLPYRMRSGWEALQRFAPIALLLVIFYGGTIISGPAAALNSLLHELIYRIATPA